MALKHPQGLKRALQSGLVKFKLALLTPLIRRDLLKPETTAGRYAHSVGLNCDHLKFDGLLRAVLDVSPEQDQQLTQLLNALESQGRLRFGLHRSAQALMTCFVRSLEHHVHFVDGGDGGYAMAAQALKAKDPRA
jgi:hypothetical protein